MIEINVRRRVPVLRKSQVIIADNSDYVLHFTFDEEWGEGEKTVFVTDSAGRAMPPITMYGDEAVLPAIRICDIIGQMNLRSQNHVMIYIGVGQGGIMTTTPLGIRVVASILTMIREEDVPQPEKLWAEALAELQRKSLDPVSREPSMLNPVGRDGEGRLWTASAAGKPYLSLERLGSYLYRVTFQTIPAYTGAGNPVTGGCTSYVQEGKLYRNFDWAYDDAAEFEVICPGFRGMALIGGLTDEHLDDGLIGQLPYHLADGRNDSGIMVSEHVLYNDWGWTGSGSVPMTQVPYRILSAVTTLDGFQEALAELLADLSVPSALAEQEYLLQFLVTDGETTYCIMPPESSSGAYQCVDISENPKLTNFRWVADETVDRADLQERPTGVERWNMIPATPEELRFTLAYESPDRLSEFIGLRGTTKDSTDEELYAIWETARAMYEGRERDGSLWQTVHSVVYSAAGVESLWVQEDYSVNRGTVGGGVSDHRQLTNRDAEEAHPMEAITGLEDALGGKQPRIADLDDIRAGAAAGSEAYRKPPCGIPKTDLGGAVRESLGKADSADEKLRTVVPSQASAENPLADKNFVNSSVQTATANFRGNWAEWSDVPEDGALYPVDFAGIRIPSTNDYTVVSDASGYVGQTLSGTWRFKYGGVWETDGKAGWNPEYQVNREPLTAAQIAALNSGITAEIVASIDGLDDALGGINDGLEAVL